MDLTNVPEHTKAGLIAMNAGKPLANITAEAVLERFEGGESITKIAGSLGISGPAIYRYLIRNAESGGREYQAANALAEHDKGEEELKHASDGVTVSRARELARLQQWKLERVLRRIYGQDAPQVVVNLNLGNVGERIAQLEQELRVQRTIEGESSPTSTEGT